MKKIIIYLVVFFLITCGLAKEITNKFDVILTKNVVLGNSSTNCFWDVNSAYLTIGDETHSLTSNPTFSIPIVSNVNYSSVSAFSSNAMTSVTVTGTQSNKLEETANAAAYAYSPTNLPSFFTNAYLSVEFTNGWWVPVLVTNCVNQ